MAVITTQTTNLSIGSYNPWPGTVTAAVNYYQRVWDDGSGGRWCYYTKTSIDPAPLSTETAPQYTGAISASSIVAIL